MAKLNYHLNGLKELQKALIERAEEESIRKVVRKHTTEIQQKTMANASSTYVKGYSTGATKKSIGISFENSGLVGIIGMGMDYNPYTEKGTRFMAAEPLLDPIFHKQKNVFVSDLERLLK